MRRVWIRITIVAVVAAIVLIFYYVYDPLGSKYMPQCLFHRLTGWECPGCGSQRMLHALLHSDFAGAFHANPFALCALPFILFYLYLEVTRTRFPGLYIKTHSTWVVSSAGFAVIAWGILRNIIPMAS